jgi:hypothetical protein
MRIYNTKERPLMLVAYWITLWIRVWITRVVHRLHIVKNGLGGTNEGGGRGR